MFNRSSGGLLDGLQEGADREPAANSGMTLHVTMDPDVPGRVLMSICAELFKIRK